MLTIGQLAAYAGTTVRAVRHYHAKGLLPEPCRDHSGYRSYDSSAVVRLVKIRTLAEAGVPLSRVRELLVAGGDEFADAVDDIDRRLRAEIRERQRHRERIARLAGGDSLALPPEATAYLDRLRGLGLSERLVTGERDAWVLVAARLPAQMPLYMTMKQQQLDHPPVLELYRAVAAVVDRGPEESLLVEVADLVVGFHEQDVFTEVQQRDDFDDQMPDELVALLDAFMLESFPGAPRLLELIEERGWRGWTRLERLSAAAAGSRPRAPSR